MFTSLRSLLCCIMLLYNMSNSSPGTQAIPTHIINSLCPQSVLEIEPVNKTSLPMVPYFAKFGSSMSTSARLQRSLDRETDRQADLHCNCASIKNINLPQPHYNRRDEIYLLQ